MTLIKRQVDGGRVSDFLRTLDVFQAPQGGTFAHDGLGVSLNLTKAVVLF